MIYDNTGARASVAGYRTLKNSRLKSRFAKAHLHTDQHLDYSQISSPIARATNAYVSLRIVRQEQLLFHFYLREEVTPGVVEREGFTHACTRARL